MNIREFRPDDTDALYEICLRTVDAGNDGTLLYPTYPELPGHLALGANLTLEPRFAFVLTADTDAPVGYVVGAVEFSPRPDNSEQLWWPPLRERYPDPVNVPPEHHTPEQRLHAIHQPILAPDEVLDVYPSHLHINLMPPAQGRGYGKLLLGSLRRATGRRLRGIFLGVPRPTPGRSALPPHGLPRDPEPATALEPAAAWNSRRRTPPMPELINVAVVGAGRRAAQYFRYVPDDLRPLIRLIAIADPSEPNREAFQRLFADSRRTRQYGDGDDMLARENPDAVIIASPNSYHARHAQLAFAAGAHVLLEKLVATSTIECQQVWQAAQAAGREASIMVGFVLRYTAFYSRIQEIVASGELGTILAIDADENLGTELTGLFHKSWRRRDDLSGGFLVEKCCHDFDILNWLIGWPRTGPTRSASAPISCPAIPRTGKAGSTQRSWASSTAPTSATRTLTLPSRCR